jgi:uncharacterized glyoxalase superfamily metalloenzyme YdcJ
MENESIEQMYRILVTGPHVTNPDVGWRGTYHQALEEKARLEQNRHVRTAEIRTA